MSTAIHPLIGQLLRYMEKVDSFMIADQWLPALKTMQLTHLRLKPAHQDKELGIRISQKINQIIQTRSPTTNSQTMRDEQNIYRDWWKQLQAIVWDKKYLEMETYSMHYSAGTKTSPK